MPLSDAHRRKKRKNFLLLGILVLFVLILYGMTIAKYQPV